MWIETLSFLKLIMLKYILHPMDAFVEIKNVYIFLSFILNLDDLDWSFVAVHVKNMFYGMRFALLQYSTPNNIAHMCNVTRYLCSFQVTHQRAMYDYVSINFVPLKCGTYNFCTSFCTCHSFIVEDIIIKR